MMNRKVKLARNILLIGLITVFFLYLFNIFLSPIRAHEASEKSMNYGPSEIIHTEKTEEGMYYLCRYEQYVSLDFVPHIFGPFWRMGVQPIGFNSESGLDVAINYYSNGDYFVLYGVISNPSITSIEIETSNGESIYHDVFYDDLFLIRVKDGPFNFIEVRGYDKDGKVIYTGEPRH